MKYNVLVVTNMYPSVSNQKGIFVKEFVDSIESHKFNVVDVVNIDDCGLGVFKYLISVVTIIKSIKKYKIDFINIHYGLSFFPVLFLMPYLKLSKVKTVLTLHGSDVMGNKVVNYCSNLGVMLTSGSIAVSNEMKKFLWKKNVNKVKVSPCGVNSSFTYINRDSWDTSKPLRLLFPSDPARPEKNYELYTAVVEKLRSQGIFIDVICFKNLNRQQILDEYRSANLIFLSSSREGSPQVIKEALMTGLPIISTDVGDVKIVTDGVANKHLCIANEVDVIVYWVVTHFVGGSIDKDLVELKREKYLNENIAKEIAEYFLSL